MVSNSWIKDTCLIFFQACFAVLEMPKNSYVKPNMVGLVILIF